MGLKIHRKEREHDGNNLCGRPPGNGEFELELDLMDR